jgi:type II secretory pathway predicted ATPase ExeA
MKPHIKVVVESPSISAGLTAFAKRYELSSRRLSKICGDSAANLSKSSADRLLRGVASVQFTEKARPLIVKGVTQFLKDLRINDFQIRAELKAIFEGELEPMISPRRVLPFDVQRYFHLRGDPFALMADPRSPEAAFTSKDLNNVAAQLEDAIRYQGFLCLIGEVGAGKSQMKARLIDTVDRSKGKLNLLWPKFAEMGRVTSGAIVNFLLESFNQTPKRRLVSAQRQLEELLEHFKAQEKYVAIGFDEAHHLNDQTLSALKNFYELGVRGYEHYLGVVMFAQPKFTIRMEVYKFREISERLEIIEMPELSKTAWDYVSHRISMVGGNAEKIIEREAVRRLATRASRPLGLGNLCNGALIDAYSAQEPKVLGTFIKKDNSEPSARIVRRA